MHRTGLIAGIIVIAGIAGFVAYDGGSRGTPPEGRGKGHAVVYKSPTCGCCVQWAAYMRKRGYEVEIESAEDMASVKERFGIPHGMESCHTAVIDGHVVEGHMPIEAIDRMLSAAPEIDGIVLPGMPSGSPGMPGPKRGGWTVFGLTSGTTTEFMTL